MDSMYKKYVEEQLPNRFVYENVYGFMTYNKIGDILQLEEIYIKPEHRRQGFASEFYSEAEKIGKELGCKELKGSIVIGTTGAEGSMKCLLVNEFKLHYTDGIFIYLNKKIGE